MGRDLITEMKQAGARAGGNINAGVCALKTPGCRCRGLGVLLDDSLPFAQANVCTCIKGCSLCGGSCRKIEGKISKPCKEPAPTKLVNLINGMKLPSKYAAASFERFNNETGNGNSVIQQVRAWLNGIIKGKGQGRGLVIGGPVGVGKTYLLAAMCKELALRGYSVRFVDFFQLLSDLRSSFSSGKAEREIIDPLLRVDILVIDELGKGRNSEWEQTVLDSLIMGRYNAGKIVVASTNYQLVHDRAKSQTYKFDIEADSRSGGFSPDVFEPLELRIGKRIYSRLVEMCAFLELTGDDVRRSGGTYAPRRQDGPSGRRV